MGKNSRTRAKEVRRRKVASFAAYSRNHTVNNCVVPKPSGKVIEEKVEWGTVYVVEGTSEWKNPKGGYPQPKNLRKKYKKKYFFKGTNIIRKIVEHPSDYNQFEDRTFRPNKGRAWYMEQVVQHKIAKWERKNPCPVKRDQNPPDIFEQEYVVPWKAKRELALERIRNFVVSIYDKLPLTGRFEKSDNNYVEEPITEIKDINGEGHNINKLDPKKSKLLKKAQKTTNEIKAKRHNLVCCNLKDHKRQKGRIILPKAA